jgi:hypothetical protein
MREFWKRPKFWIVAILILWLIYIIDSNFQLNPVEIRLVPKLVILQLRVSAVIIASAIVGSAATLIIQYYWRNRRSNIGSRSTVESPSSTRTVP